MSSPNLVAYSDSTKGDPRKWLAVTDKGAFVEAGEVHVAPSTHKRLKYDSDVAYGTKKMKDGSSSSVICGKEDAVKTVAKALSWRMAIAVPAQE